MNTKLQADIAFGTWRPMEATPQQYVERIVSDGEHVAVAWMVWLTGPRQNTSTYVWMRIGYKRYEPLDFKPRWWKPSRRPQQWSGIGVSGVNGMQWQQPVNITSIPVWSQQGQQLASITANTLTAPVNSWVTLVAPTTTFGTAAQTSWIP